MDRKSAAMLHALLHIGWKKGKTVHIKLSSEKVEWEKSLVLLMVGMTAVLPADTSVCMVTLFTESSGMLLSYNNGVQISPGQYLTQSQSSTVLLQTITSIVPSYLILLAHGIVADNNEHINMYKCSFCILKNGKILKLLRKYV